MVTSVDQTIASVISMPRLQNAHAHTHETQAYSREPLMMLIVMLLIVIMVAVVLAMMVTVTRNHELSSTAPYVGTCT